jgi:hypothetical protein
MDLKELCGKGKMNLAAIAKMLGVSDSAAADIESGCRKAGAMLAEACKKVCEEVNEYIVKNTRPPEQEVRPSAVKVEPIEVKAAPVEEKTAPVEEKAAPVAEKAASVKEKKAKAAEKKTSKTAAVKAAPVEEKAAPAAEEAKPADKKAAPAAKKTTKKVKKEAPAEKQETPMECELIIQSPEGGEVTPEAILEKLGDVDKVYIRVDENKAYWVKGEDSGEINLW